MVELAKFNNGEFNPSFTAFISCTPFCSSFEDMGLDCDELDDIEFDVVKLESGQSRFWLRSFISPVPPGDPFNIIELEDVEGVELDSVELDVDEFDIIELEKLDHVELDEVVPGMWTAYLRTYLGM